MVPISSYAHLMPAPESRIVTSPGLVKAFLLTLPLWSGIILLMIYLGSVKQYPSKSLVIFQVCVYGACVIVLTWNWFRKRKYYEDLGWFFLLVGHLVWFAIPALYQAVMPGLWFGNWIGKDVPNDALLTAGLLISVFLLMNGIGYYIGKRKAWKRQVPAVVPSNFLVLHKHRLFLVLALLLIGLLPYFLFGSSLSNTISGILAGRIDKAWAASPESGYEGNSLMTLFWLTRAFLVAAAALGGCYLVADKASSLAQRMVYLLVFLLSSLLLYFDQGTRSILMMSVGPVFVLYILRRAQHGRKFSRRRLVMVGTAVAISLLVLTQIQLYYRLERTRESLSTQPILELMAPRQQSDFYTEAATAVVVADSPLSEDLHESPLLFFLANPIPRVFWPDKPMPQTMQKYSLYRWGVDIWEKGGNALPSVVGQYYMNWGIIGVVWAGFLYGILAAWAGRFATGRRQYYEFVVLGTSAMTFLFVSFRFLFPGFHYSTLLMAIILLFYRHSMTTQNELSSCPLLAR